MKDWVNQFNMREVSDTYMIRLFVLNYFSPNKIDTGIFLQRKIMDLVDRKSGIYIKYWHQSQKLLSPMLRNHEILECLYLIS